MLRLVQIAVLCACTLIGTLAVTTPARAAKPAGMSDLSRWKKQASARVPVVMDTPVVLSSCPFADPRISGCWQTQTVYVNPLYAHRPVLMRFVLLHELGHAYADRFMSAGRRAAFKKILGDTRPWQLPCSGLDCAQRTVGPPSEWFGNAFARCAWPDRRWPQVMHYSYEPTASQERRVCALLKRAQKDFVR